MQVELNIMNDDGLHVYELQEDGSLKEIEFTPIDRMEA